MKNVLYLSILLESYVLTYFVLRFEPMLPLRYKIGLDLALNLIDNRAALVIYIVSKLLHYAAQWALKILFFIWSCKLHYFKFFYGFCTLLMHLTHPKLKNFIVKSLWTRNNLIMHLQNHLVVSRNEFWCEANNPRFEHDFL